MREGEGEKWRDSTACFANVNKGFSCQQCTLDFIGLNLEIQRVLYIHIEKCVFVRKRMRKRHTHRDA